MARREDGAAVVYRIVGAMAGSISAEHGLGTMKTAVGASLKSPTELAALRAIRAALDPARIMNPRVLF
jgi:FAD/FMN-containing dehydrogenase